jgi:mono/diheme cytochrome c family protein
MMGPVLSLGCGASEEPGAPADVPVGAREPAVEAPASDTSSAADEAEQLFATRCFTCHGAEGRGDGPGSASLEPKPRNFQDLAWQAQVSDEDLERIILYGGAAVGRSPTMPGNPDLMSRAEVVTALVKHLRDLGTR